MQHFLRFESSDAFGEKKFNRSGRRAYVARTFNEVGACSNMLVIKL